MWALFPFCFYLMQEHTFVTFILSYLAVMTVHYAVGFGVFSLVLPFMLSLLYICYTDQHMHNIYIYINILYIVSTATCFSASAL